MPMLKIAARLLTLFFLILAASGGQALAFEIKEVQSPGGIKAWLVEDHAVPLMAMQFSFRGGSSLDPEDKQGLSLFLSGMLDEGAGDIDSREFQRRRDRLAFKLSFDSSADNFEGKFETLTRNRDQSLELLRMAITLPRFDAEPLERMRNQFLLSAREKSEDPEGIAFNRWMQRTMPGDPYARPQSGNEEGLSRITAEDLRALHNRLFNRTTLQVAVVGDIDARTLEAVLDRVFGDLPTGSEAEMPVAPKVESGPQLEVVPRDMPQSVIVFGHEAIKRDDPDFIAAYVMMEILGGDGFGARLTEEIREKRGLTYGVGMSLSPLERAGFALGFMSTRNETAGEALKLIRETIARYVSEGPTQRELDETKTYLTGSYALRFSGNGAIASQLLSIQQQNLGIDYIGKRNGLVEAVTLEQVRTQARRLLHPDKLIVSIVGKPVGVD